MTVSSEIEGNDNLMTLAIVTLAKRFWQPSHGACINHGFLLGKTLATVSKIIFSNTFDIERSKHILKSQYRTVLSRNTYNLSISACHQWNMDQSGLK